MKEDIVVVCETTTTIIVHFCRLSQLVRPIYAPCGTRRIMGAIEEKEFLNLGQRGISVLYLKTPAVSFKVPYFLIFVVL